MVQRLVFNIVAQAQYNARRAGITSAIVIAILIPVGICGFCLILKLRESASERSAGKSKTYYGGGGGNDYQDAPRNSGTNDMDRRSGSGSSGKATSPAVTKANDDNQHQGVYYTNEPLYQ